MIESIDFVTIATNGYEKYARDLLDSAETKLRAESKVKFHIFTDAVSSFNQLNKEVKNIDLCFHEIQTLKWPDATIKRFELINKNFEHLDAQVIAWIDADMLIHQDFLLELNPAEWTNGYAFVSHPGYWRSDKLLKRILCNPKRGYKDLVRLFTRGGLGTWEIRPTSSAYVPRNNRKNYCCGGFWLGRRVPILDFTKQMELKVNKDLKNNLLATWHDESYLNNFVSNNQVTLLPPDFCYDLIYRMPESIKCKIEAVRKVEQ